MRWLLGALLIFHTTSPSKVILKDFTSDAWVCVRYENFPPTREVNLSCAPASMVRTYILRNGQEP